MEKEILETFFTKIDKKYFDKNSITLKILLLVCIIFLVADGMLWYRIYINAIFTREITFRNYLLPVTIFTVFVLFIFSWSNNLKANLLLKKSIADKNGDLLNSGLRKLFFANLIALIALCSAISSAVIEIILN